MPFIRGMLRSSRIKRRVVGRASRLSRSRASAPFVATNTWFVMFALVNARLTVITSTSSSSTSKMVSALSSMCLSSGVAWPREVEDRAAAASRIDPRSPSVRLDDLAHDRQPDTSALHLVATLERLEQPPDPIVEFRGDADAVVDHAELPVCALTLSGELDRQISTGVVLDRVA